MLYVRVAKCTDVAQFHHPILSSAEEREVSDSNQTRVLRIGVAEADDSPAHVAEQEENEQREDGHTVDQHHVIPGLLAVQHLYARPDSSEDYKNGQVDFGFRDEAGCDDVIESIKSNPIVTIVEAHLRVLLEFGAQIGQSLGDVRVSWRCIVGWWWRIVGFEFVCFGGVGSICSESVRIACFGLIGSGRTGRVIALLLIT